MFLSIFTELSLKFIFDFFYFPIWWYSQGLVRILNFFYNQFLYINSNLAPGLWLKNIFVPMYGQWDWQGRLTSFFVRLGNVIVRYFLLLFFLILFFIGLIIYLILPLFILANLIKIFTHLL